MDALDRGLSVARRRASPVLRAALGIGWALPTASGHTLYFLVFPSSQSLVAPFPGNVVAPRSQPTPNRS